MLGVLPLGTSPLGVFWGEGVKIPQNVQLEVLSAFEIGVSWDEDPVAEGYEIRFRKTEIIV